MAKMEVAICDMCGNEAATQDWSFDRSGLECNHLRLKLALPGGGKEEETGYDLCDSCAGKIEEILVAMQRAGGNVTCHVNA